MVLDPLEAKCKLATQICKSDWSKWIFAKIGNASVISINQMCLTYCPYVWTSNTFAKANSNHKKCWELSTKWPKLHKFQFPRKSRYSRQKVWFGYNRDGNCIRARRQQKNKRKNRTADYPFHEISDLKPNWFMISWILPFKNWNFLSCCYTAITNKASSHTWS